MSIILSSILILSCGDTKTKQTVSKLPTIDENTETEITVWAWNVAAKALVESAKSFNQKYPRIKVNVQEYGLAQNVYERYSVILSSGVGVPDIIQIESDYVQTFAETYPQYFFDMNGYIDIDGKVDPSKISTSYDSEGKLVSIPWDSGPVVMFYREDLFNQAGIDINSIITFEDYISAGKKLKEKFPNITMTGLPFTQDENLFRCLLVANKSYYLNNKGEITVASSKAIETLQMIKRLIDEGVAKNTINWDGGIVANKNGELASWIMGGWWGGTIKDQMPEMKGKWKIAPIPAFPDGARASSSGGAGLSITASEPIKQAAALEFIKESLMNVDNQLMMYEKYSLFPSYLPTYDDARFLKSDDYFGDDFNKILADVTKEIPNVIYASKDFAEIKNTVVSVYEDVLNNNRDIKSALEQAASQISGATGRKIVK
ncbi:sugar ABC transporter substrate-binding protein [Brachyspira aalborgi]|uniref:Sugar ABC transporter substrate-binding protein n=1 Tax=Brachyspira aalborgi TaxID=29522 RepID=A0AB38Q2Y8_9SPIR|nr:sugar ABC transporter substrate-binding protein [Brachyspira aalborgi]TXJ22243.1 sugar ABC transporter substrate-binding protein [Brachyspira aalborgi]TXJ28204.1 sugar ABC transporter substrate-binding protein [Brachyspira aalborgi]TXJ33789.1 sugar ABC transporter substrate-binding protein [Brachyspira aalborgi]TXJ45168.1 sugar ABC transporter substrate-binding protein [Brachyspira aalborgi]